MNIIIIAIGNELLNGEILDTNSRFLEQELAHYGQKVHRVVLIRDDMDAIETEIKRCIGEADYLFIMGGLGPTEDDLTRYAVAKALDQELIQDLNELKEIQKKFEAYGHKMTSNNERQSFFPSAAKNLGNPIGTASGFYLLERDCNVFVLPGVPSELKLIFQDSIVPILNEQWTQSIVINKLIVKVIGVGESTLDTMIKEEIAPKHSIRWEIIAKAEGVFLKFYPIDELSKDNWKEPLQQDLERHLGHQIYGYDSDDMNEIIAKLLLKDKLKLGTIESCTGGYVSKYITDRSGSSRYYVGGMITYTNDLKNRLAHVSSKLLEQYGAVSVETAEAMARGAKKALASDITLAITGIAGPTGGTPEKPVGTVCFALLDHKNRLTLKKRIFVGDRSDVRVRSLF
ncbi:MAG TPA: CinA family nicotinamide mononucleotide deamidase-related protein, partial [Spirochaetes bacterium]|nr:CinA family nicotinamide mononucleotide deamidase-related protein [Spirochaetota bacterium]